MIPGLCDFLCYLSRQNLVKIIEAIELMNSFSESPTRSVSATCI